MSPRASASASAWISTVKESVSPLRREPHPGDLAQGYKAPYEAERGWRDLKHTIDMQRLEDVALVGGELGALGDGAFGDGEPYEVHRPCVNRPPRGIRCDPRGSGRRGATRRDDSSRQRRSWPPASQSPSRQEGPKPSQSWIDHRTLVDPCAAGVAGVLVTTLSGRDARASSLACSSATDRPTVAR